MSSWWLPIVSVIIALLINASTFSDERKLDRKPAILHAPSDIPVGENAHLYVGLGETYNAYESAPTPEENKK